MNTQNESRLIDIEEVAEEFGLSVKRIRDYKSMGLIKVVRKEKNRDIFDREDIRRRKSIIDQLRAEGWTLRRVADVIDGRVGCYFIVFGVRPQQNWQHLIRILSHTAGLHSLQ